MELNSARILVQSAGLYQINHILPPSVSRTSNELQVEYLCPHITTSKNNNYLFIYPKAYVDLQSEFVFVIDGLNMRSMVGEDVEGVVSL